MERSILEFIVVRFLNNEICTTLDYPNESFIASMAILILLFNLFNIYLVELDTLTESDKVLFSKALSNRIGLTFLDKISVRESSTELQVSVDDKIFVFGKAKGTLNKVKVGMHVLPFSQEIEGNENKFSKVSWKKLKDGSIQIQSSYSPWPTNLTWTVYSDGLLKMEASAFAGDLADRGWSALGFNYPDQTLNQVSWNSSTSDFGQWKNHNYHPMANPDLEIQTENQGFFQPIQSVKFEFETITLAVKSNTGGIFLGLGKFPNRYVDYPGLSSDLIFLFNQHSDKVTSLPQSPSGESINSNIKPKELLVLWFHFQ